MGEDQDPPQDMGAMMATMQKAAQQRLRENLKTYLDVSKHLTTITGALSATTAVIYQAFEVTEAAAVGAFLAFFISFYASMWAMLSIADFLAKESLHAMYESKARILVRVSVSATLGGTCALILGAYLGR